MTVLRDFRAEQEDLSWMDEGVCAQVGDDLWFPEKGGSTREAKQVCAGCPVKADCLEYALRHDIRTGVWGGKAERERRVLQRKRRQGSQEAAA